MKALNGLSAANGGEAAPAAEEKKPTAKPQEQPKEEYNAMAGVLERHEAIANRVRNKR